MQNLDSGKAWKQYYSLTIYVNGYFINFSSHHHGNRLIFPIIETGQEFVLQSMRIRINGYQVCWVFFPTTSGLGHFIVQGGGGLVFPEEKKRSIQQTWYDIYQQKSPSYHQALYLGLHSNIFYQEKGLVKVASLSYEVCTQTLSSPLLAVQKQNWEKPQRRQNMTESHSN